MTSSASGAERDTSPEPFPGATEDSASQWKREANRRLAIHRARRGNRTALQGALPGMEDAAANEEAPSQPKNKSVADRVAARYAKAPTYSEMLAAEARNVARAATAAAVAANEARDAAQAILIGLDADSYDDLSHPYADASSEQSAHIEAPEPQSRDLSHHISLHRDEARSSQPRVRPAITEAVEDDDFDREDKQHAAAPIQPLPAKLIEFPRELVAARKARPRLAEGPLREEYDRDATKSQLRIFEVQSETISTEPEVQPLVREWSPIRLDSVAETVPLWRDEHQRAQMPAVHATQARQDAALDLPLQTASLEDRLMAGLVDAGLITGGFLLFLLVFASCTTHLPTGLPAEIAAGAALLAFAAIYLLLFFNFGTDTPGMRYAKIALCTFDDENPNRQTMRRRLAAVLLSVAPVGLGILWAFFDADRLGWHDRISRTYQRSYK